MISFRPLLSAVLMTAPLVLAGAANAPVDRFELARGSAEAAGRAVDIQVTRLRRKIEDDPKNPRYLQTVRGVGYMLAPDA